jgi:hypothetical protein
VVCPSQPPSRGSASAVCGRAASGATDRGEVRPDEGEQVPAVGVGLLAEQTRRLVETVDRSISVGQRAADDAREVDHPVTVMDGSQTGSGLAVLPNAGANRCAGEVLPCADRSTSSTMADLPVRQTGRCLPHRRGHRAFRCRRTESRGRSTAAERGAGEWHTRNPGRLPGLKPLRILWVCTVAGEPFHLAEALRLGRLARRPAGAPRPVRNDFGASGSVSGREGHPQQGRRP